jgi:type VI protein secretion system component VasK
VIVLGSVVISVVVLTALLLLWRRRRQRAIIEAVERQADSLDPAELESLVERLETEHGKLEMRRLRRLVKERPRA